MALADEVSISNKKRCREQEFLPEEDDSPDVSPEAKRLRDDFFLEILDDDDGSGEDLAFVMKSLEEEIALQPPAEASAPAAVVTASDGPTPVISDLDDARMADLGYLLEASDDELGLPPPPPAQTSPSSDSGAPDSGDGEVEAAGFGQIWGFDDEISGCYDGMGFGFRQEDNGVAPAAAEDGVIFEGGLFDYADVLCGPSDFSDFSWRPESLPAV